MAVGTALTVASIGVSAGTAGVSFAQAAKQNKLQKKAEREAKLAVEEARKRLDVNVYDALSLPKEAYELEREAMIVSGAQALEAARESERGVAATAGRVQMAQNEAQRRTRSDMAQRLFDIETKKAGEEGRLLDMGMNLDVMEAAGAQEAARDAQMAKAAAIEGGMSALQSGVQTAVEAAPLYAKTRSAKENEKLMAEFTKMQEAGNVDPNLSYYDWVGKQLGLDFTGAQSDMVKQAMLSEVDAKLFKDLYGKIPVFGGGIGNKVYNTSNASYLGNFGNLTL